MGAFPAELIYHTQNRSQAGTSMADTAVFSQADLEGILAALRQPFLPLAVPLLRQLILGLPGHQLLPCREAKGCQGSSGQCVGNAGSSPAPGTQHLPL